MFDARQKCREYTRTHGEDAPEVAPGGPTDPAGPGEPDAAADLAAPAGGTR